MKYNYLSKTYMPLVYKKNSLSSSKEAVEHTLEKEAVEHTLDVSNHNHYRTVLKNTSKSKVILSSPTEYLLH